MLHRRQALDQPRAALMNEQARWEPRPGVAKAMQDFSPPIHTVRVRSVPGVADAAGIRRRIDPRARGRAALRIFAEIP